MKEGLGEGVRGRGGEGARKYFELFGGIHVVPV